MIGILVVKKNNQYLDWHHLQLRAKHYLQPCDINDGKLV